MGGWKPEVQIVGAGDKWHRNGLVFPTEAEARDNAEALKWKWILVTEFRAVWVEDAEPNYRWVGGKLVTIDKLPYGVM